MSELTCIDNAKGVCLQTGINSNEISISLKDSKIYGETEALDCPDSRECWCHPKMGLMTFGNNLKSKKLHPNMASALPVYKIKSEGAWGGDVLIYNVDFLNFKTDQTACRSTQKVFGRNKYASDKIPLHTFKNSKFVNVGDNAMAWWEESPEGWANLSDCG